MSFERRNRKRKERAARAWLAKTADRYKTPAVDDPDGRGGGAAAGRRPELAAAPDTPEGAVA